MKILFLIFSLLFVPALYADRDFHILVFTDTHVGATKKMDPAPSAQANNDMDVDTFKSYLDDIHNLVNHHTLNPDAVILLGDLVDHFDGGFLGNPTGREKQLQTNFAYFLQTFDHAPLSYVFGNNDTLLGDYQEFFDPDYVTHSPYEIAVNAGWKKGFLSQGENCPSNSYPCQISENLENGYYASYLAPKLRLIILNSVLFENEHSRTYHGDNYNGEMIWLNQQILAAKANGDSVLLAMHVPPGNNPQTKKPFWQTVAMQTFSQQLKLYPTGIIAILAGHTHMEAIEIVKIEKRYTIPLIINPGLSTSHGNAPAFKDLTLTQKENGQWVLTDYTTYHLGATGFKPLYQFNQAYCASDVKATVSACLNAMMEAQQLDKFLDTMNQYFTVGNPNNHMKLPVVDPAQLIFTID